MKYSEMIASVSQINQFISQPENQFSKAEPKETNSFDSLHNSWMSQIVEELNKRINTFNEMADAIKDLPSEMDEVPTHPFLAMINPIMAAYTLILEVWFDYNHYKDRENFAAFLKEEGVAA